MAAAPIPIIDLTAADEGDAARAAVAKELVDAAIEHGFVYIRNTGQDIPANAVDGMFDISRKLFALPTTDKESCSIQENNRGWTGMHVETLDPDTQRIGDSKEAFNFGAFVNGQAQQPIPSAVEADQPHIATFLDLCHRLCLKLNGLLGLGLEVDPPDFFEAAHRKEAGPSGNTLRLLYYPPPREASATAGEGIKDEEEIIRAGAHSDYGSVTLLFRLPGQAGLEICTRDGSWAPVPVVPRSGTIDVQHDPSPPILINIADLLEYWTGGLLRSTVHRVTFPTVATNPAGDCKTVHGETTTDPRYSIAYFCHPAGETPLTPVPSARVARAVAEQQKTAAATATATAAAPGSKVLTANEHLQMRLRATYLSSFKK